MIPEGGLSSTPVPGQITGGRALTETFFRDFETAGVDFNDPSQGLQVKVWRARIVNNSRIVLDAEGVPETEVIIAAGVSEVSFSFDSNMEYAVAYMQGNLAQLSWFDTTVNERVLVEYPGVTNPRLTLDDKRATQTDRELILAYVRDNNLYIRQQSDRFLVEILLQENVNARLLKFGLNDQLRLQFEFIPLVEKQHRGAGRSGGEPPREKTQGRVTGPQQLREQARMQKERDLMLLQRLEREEAARKRREYDAIALLLLS